MSEEIFLEGKTYVSSKRAADQTGYAQDYIGQLARKGLVDAQRVGGLWYVHLDSLAGYQRNSASYSPVAPVNTQRDLDSVITFEGKDYVSASRASKLTGYNQDYVGQLARSGKILSRQIGNRWYVDREMLLAHKSQKDSLLAAVQADSLGIQRPMPAAAPVAAYTAHEEPLLTYLREDDKALLPLSIGGPDRAVKEAALPKATAAAPTPSTTAIPIRRAVPRSSAAPVRVSMAPKSKRSKRIGLGKTMVRATGVGVALTFVIVLSYGFTTLKAGSVYTVNIQKAGALAGKNQFTAAASEAADKLLAKIESWVAPQLNYERN